MIPSIIGLLEKSGWISHSLVGETLKKNLQVNLCQGCVTREFSLEPQPEDYGSQNPGNCKLDPKLTSVWSRRLLKLGMCCHYVEKWYLWRIQNEMCHGRIKWGFVGDEVEIICLCVLFMDKAGIVLISSLLCF